MMESKSLSKKTKKKSKPSKLNKKKKKESKSIEETDTGVDTGAGVGVEPTAVPDKATPVDNETVKPDGGGAGAGAGSGSEDDGTGTGGTGAPTPTGTFASLGLCSAVVSAIDDMGWTTPTPIQTKAIPYALAGRDVIGLAETGSGKTGAFALPILHQLLQHPARLFALVLAPTRELADDIATQFKTLGASIDLDCAVIVGGVDMMQQSIALARKPHVIVATPGRLVDHLENTRGFSLLSLKYLVMDEADRMLSLDFEEAIDTILANIPKQRTTCLYSATMTSKVAKLQRASLTDPKRVEVSSSKYATVDTLRQEYLFIPAKDKDTYLAHVLNEFSGKQAIVFVGTCAATQRVASMLKCLGFEVAALNGQMKQENRRRSLLRFRGGKDQILLATDVAARGLDIPTVDVVLNFDLPASAKTYVHRVGRTARAGRAGRAISFVTQYDVPTYQRLEKYIGMKLPEFVAEKRLVMALHERVEEAQRMASLELRERDASRARRGKKARPAPDGAGGGGGGRGAEGDAAAAALMAKSSSKRRKLAAVAKRNKKAGGGGKRR